MKTEKKKSLLLEADEAEQEALKVRDSGERDAWLMIAQRYRDLAEEKTF
jgi:uncharacterized alpha-E superfamily protein